MLPTWQTIVDDNFDPNSIKPETKAIHAYKSHDDNTDSLNLYSIKKYTMSGNSDLCSCLVRNFVQGPRGKKALAIA